MSPEPKLAGIRHAFDEVLVTGLTRQHPVQQIAGELLRAEIAERQARSIRYQLAAARQPLAKEIADCDFVATPVTPQLLRDLATGAFLAQQRNAVLLGRTGTGKTHLTVAVARSCIRGGARARFSTVVYLVNRLEAGARAGQQGRLADQLTRFDLVVLDDLPIAEWPSVFGGGAKMTTAPLDRLTNHRDGVESGRDGWRFKQRA